MKNCPFSSTPGEIKECGPDCSFYNQNEDRCGILEIVGVLKELNEKSESLKTCFADIRDGQNILNEKIKELPSSQNIGEGVSSVSDSISALPEKISQTLEPISRKIDSYRTTADSILELLKKSASTLDEIHSSSEIFISGDVIGLLKNTLSELTELKHRIDFGKLENAISELGKNEKDYYDTLAVDINNSIEKSQALFTENISSYLSSVSSHLQKISSEPNYAEILEYLRKNDDKKTEEREKLFKRFEELSKQNQSDLLSSVESYFVSLKGEISSLPSSVSEIEKFIKNNDVIEFLREKESRENELANILLANVSNILSKNQQSLVESLSIYINSLSSALNAIPESMAGIENAVKAGDISSFVKEKEARDREHSAEIAQKITSLIERTGEILSGNVSSSLESIDTNLKDIPFSFEKMQKVLAETSPLEFLKEREARDRQYLGNHLINLAQLLKQNQSDLLSSVESYFSSLKGEISSLPSSVSEIEKFIKNNDVIEFLREKESRENELANILLANVSNILSKNQHSLVESLSIYINSLSSALNAIPESMTGIENAVKAGDISSFVKEKEARDREYQEKMNGALIHVIENGYQEFSKSTEEQVSQLSEKLTELSQTISDNRTSLGEALRESNMSLGEKYSQEISDGFAKLMQNLIPVSKMSASGIMEIRDEIKQNLLTFFTEKEKKDRLFLKEAIARWIEAYGTEQKSLFDIISAMNTSLEKITKSLTHISDEANQAKLTDFLQSFAKNFSAVEGKKIQMLVDFRNIVSSKILPHIHNISAIAELQKNATEASVKLASEVARQNEGVALSNQEMTKMISNASGSINKAFTAIEKLAAAQNQSIEKLDGLSAKLDEILRKQMIVFENEQKNFILLEKESKKSKAMIHNDRGVGFYHTKQYQSALKEFSTAIELFPEIYEPYLNLGVVFSEIGEKEKSKKYFSKVIEMNPDAVEAYINLGMLYVFDDKFDQAETYLKESIKVSPSYARSYSALGEVYFRTKNYKLAEEAWKKALEINPMDEEASLGLKQLRGGDLAE